MRRGTTTQRAVSGLVAVGCVAGLGAGVAGCSGDPGPSQLPTPVEVVTPSPTPTPTPTPTPDAATKPERPEAMEVADSAGAEATAVYFLELFPYVFATGDLEDYRELSHPECIYCASVIGHVQTMVAAGQRSEGGLGGYSEIVSTEVEPGRWWLVQLTLVEQPSVTLGASDSLVEEFPGVKTYRTDIAVVREGDAWLIREVTHTRQASA